MANNKNYIEDLTETRNFLNKVRTLSETMNFDENYDMNEIEFDSDNMENNIEDSHETPDKYENEVLDIDSPNEIDTIREITLKGMLKYAKNSKSPEYETLKKIFQFCDKVNNEKTENKE